MCVRQPSLQIVAAPPNGYYVFVLGIYKHLTPNGVKSFDSCRQIDRDLSSL